MEDIILSMLATFIKNQNQTLKQKQKDHFSYSTKVLINVFIFGYIYG